MSQLETSFFRQKFYLLTETRKSFLVLPKGAEIISLLNVKNNIRTWSLSIYYLNIASSCCWYLNMLVE